MSCAVRAADEPNGPESPTLMVGAARVDITPSTPIWLNGYAARTEPAQAVSQPIHARALAIGQQGAEPAVIVAFDGLGVSAGIFAAVAERLRESHSITAERLAICTTHAHTAPFLPDVAPVIFGQALEEDDAQRAEAYRKLLVDRLIDVARQALDGMQPASLGWATGKVGFARNRRQQGGPVDHRLPVLVARAADGELLAVLATYACHCTTLDAELNAVHGDWAGCAAAAIEQAHPGCVSLITIGCGADANPDPRPGLELAEQHGRALADEVERLLAGNELRPITSAPECRSGAVGLPYDQPPTIDQWRAAIAEPKFEGYRARLQVERFESEGSLPAALDYRIAAWSFGNDVAMVFLPGEVVVDYAIRIAEDFDPDRMWVHAYSNDAPCYIPSRRVRMEGGYEGGGAMVYYNQPAPLVPESEQLIIDTIQRLTPHRFYGSKLLADHPAPVDAGRSTELIEVAPGLRVQLVAAEPLIADPVAFDWSPDGRLWVVEMGDYPLGLGAEHRPGGRVVVLDDDNGDGVYDRSQVFADGLPYPCGIKLWRDGVLVSAAPDILLLRDTDGDGRGDSTTRVLRGLGEGNPQHRANGLRWGLDNWLYLGAGDGTDVVESGSVRIDVRGRDLRLWPDEPRRIEAQSGKTQFGRTQNDWGEWFGNDNSNPLWHYVLDDHYLRRNAFVRVPAVKRDVPEQAGAAPVFPISRTLERFNDLYAANRFTSACSPEIYRDTLLGDEYAGNAFICEPVHNLVHREVIVEDGVSYRGTRAPAEAQREFLASRDNWFRGVMVRTGPDGALWIADMYRYVIEHTTWIPEDFQRRMDVRAGSDRGRIYRVLPMDREGREWKDLPRLGRTELVRRLESPNGWVRDTVQQLLLWNPSSDDIEPLRKLVRSSSMPQAKIHALHTLAGRGSLDDELLLGALGDDHVEVRRHAVRLSEPRLDESSEILQAVVQLAGRADNAPRLRLQLAYSLGASHSDQAADRLVDVLFANADSPEIVAAALSSLRNDTLARVLRQTLQHPDRFGQAELVAQVVRIAWRMAPEVAAAVVVPAIESGTAPDHQRLRVRLLASLRRDAPDDGAANGAVARLVRQQLRAARAVALDNGAEVDDRVDAIYLLRESLASEPAYQDAMIALVQSADADTRLRQAALDAMVRAGEAGPIERMIRGSWSTIAPAHRVQLLESLLGKADSAKSFLRLVADQHVPLADVPTLYRQRFLQFPDEAVRRLASELIVDAGAEDRRALVDRYLAEMGSAGDAANGAKLFERHCAACHRLGEVGQAVGPDLVSLTDRSPTALATAMLDPNRAVDDKFFGFTIETQDGLQISGLIQQETTNQLAILAPDGQTHRVLRADLAAIRATGKSFMPEGLEQEISPQQMADLVALIRSHRPPSKSYPNHQPRVVEANDEGTLTLGAEQSYIYGGRLIFEQRHKNLGWWEREGDHATWDVRVPAAGNYRVKLTYACDDSSAGNRFVLMAGPSRLEGAIESTHGWDHYTTLEVGTVQLPAGPVDVTVTNAGSIRGELFDLRSVTLEPETSGK